MQSRNYTHKLYTALSSVRRTAKQSTAIATFITSTAEVKGQIALLILTRSPNWNLPSF